MKSEEKANQFFIDNPDKTNYTELYSNNYILYAENRYDTNI
jgi:hypothetical protein